MGEGFGQGFSLASGQAMFSGIVEEVGAVKSIVTGRGTWHLTVGCSVVLKDTKPADSVAVNGVCLTVVNVTRGGFSVDVIEQTFRTTNISKMRAGDNVNLERSLGVESRLGGHFVTGHVDGNGTVQSVLRSDGKTRLDIGIKPDIAKFIVPKGSVSVDGVSLTVIEPRDGKFSVFIVPYTGKMTTLGDATAGRMVNIETDILGKYVYRFLSGKGQPDNKMESNVNEEFLREHGFA
jgi:riboflavin synthase